MNTNNFQSLIQKVTGRNFLIDTTDTEIVNGKEYWIYITLPVTKRNISFKWKAAMNDEKILRSFITAFCSKYREPNPAHYKTCSPYFSPSWDEMTAEKQEYAYMHHASNMYSKDQLMKQVEDNFSSNDMKSTLIRYGFYPTEYGVGIFCYFASAPVISAIDEMKKYLSGLSMPFKNEFSDARWVFRFKLGLTKEQHTAIINSFK